MRRWSLIGLALVVGCETYETADGVLEPVTVSAPAPAAAPLKAVTEVVEPPTDGEKPPAAEEPATTPPSAKDLYVAMGMGDAASFEEQVGATEPAPTTTEPAAPAPAKPGPMVPAAAPAPLAIPPGFGVRLLATVAGAQPPRAILGLPDGREVVVRPGDMVPDAHLVVMGVGRGVVQLAEVVPMGDSARIEARQLVAMYPETHGGGAP